MNETLKGKKILLLGGALNMVDIVNLAHSMGMIVYITDYYDTDRSPAKLVADYYTNISISDYDKVCEYIKENQIDGVMTGFTDSYLEHYLSICKKANLPYYGDINSFSIATNKMSFKEACRKYGVQTIPGLSSFSFDKVEDFAKENGYPLILKPADNSGSRGVIKCESEDKLKECYDYAFSFSPTKNVIVERFMDCPSVGIVYEMEGKTPHLVAMCDRDVYNSATGSAIISGTRYPSVYLTRYINEMDKPMKEMLKNSGFNHGMVSPMAFVDDKGFYLCEMCYRPSGGHHYILINDQNGIDGLLLLLEYAVTGKIDSYDSNKETPFFKDYCGMVHIIGKPGKKIAKYTGIDEINLLDGVILGHQDLSVGDTIGRDGTSAQMIASFWLKAKNEDEYYKLIKKIKEMLGVFDEEGNSLVLL